MRRFEQVVEEMDAGWENVEGSARSSEETWTGGWERDWERVS
jgi:hypothetical protein